jgi:hypothetical protein
MSGQPIVGSKGCLRQKNCRLSTCKPTAHHTKFGKLLNIVMPQSTAAVKVCDKRLSLLFTSAKSVTQANAVLFVNVIHMP